MPESPSRISLSQVRQLLDQRQKAVTSLLVIEEVVRRLSMPRGNRTEVLEREAQGHFNIDWQEQTAEYALTFTYAELCQLYERRRNAISDQLLDLGIDPET